jgi:hypothetical protein
VSLGGLFWVGSGVVLGYSGWSWIVLGWFWVVLGVLGVFWVVLGGSGVILSVLVCSEWFSHDSRWFWKLLNDCFCVVLRCFWGGMVLRSFGGSSGWS